jgi:hypothetical protein
VQLDPIDCRTIAVCALAAIAELRQSPDCALVPLQVEPADEVTDVIVRCRGGLATELACDREPKDGEHSRHRDARSVRNHPHSWRLRQFLGG